MLVCTIASAQSFNAMMGMTYRNAWGLAIQVDSNMRVDNGTPISVRVSSEHTLGDIQVTIELAIERKYNPTGACPAQLWDTHLAPATPEGATMLHDSSFSLGTAKACLRTHTKAEGDTPAMTWSRAVVCFEQQFFVFSAAGPPMRPFNLSLIKSAYLSLVASSSLAK